MGDALSIQERGTDGYNRFLCRIFTVLEIGYGIQEILDCAREGGFATIITEAPPRGGSKRGAPPL